MKKASVLVASTALLSVGACTGGTTGEPTMTASATGTNMTETTTSSFRRTADWPYGKRFGLAKVASLPVPVRAGGRLLIGLFSINHGVMASLDLTPEERERGYREVCAPSRVQYFDPATATLVDDTMVLNERRPAHFGLPDPPGGVVGRYDDPSRLPEDRLAQLRQRIFAALDILLPLFADSSRPWTDEANKAAQEVRDFFPLAAEPGLWPYYRAEGREMFAWVEQNAPPGKAPLPWEDDGR